MELKMITKTKDDNRNLGWLQKLKMIKENKDNRRH